MTPEVTLRLWNDERKLRYMIAIMGGGTRYDVVETKDQMSGEVVEIRFIPKRRKQYTNLPRIRSV